MVFPPCTMWQVASHGSPGAPLAEPSSQSSPQSIVPLPHASFWHVGEQPSHGVLLPSSHCSPPSSVPFPHTAPCAHAGSVGVRQPGCGAQSRVGAMLAEPSTIGGFDGSRYSRRLWPEGFELSCPPIVIR